MTWQLTCSSPWCHDDVVIEIELWENCWITLTFYETCWISHPNNMCCWFMSLFIMVCWIFCVFCLLDHLILNRAKNSCWFTSYLRHVSFFILLYHLTFCEKAVVSPHGLSIVFNHLIYAQVTLFDRVTFLNSSRINSFYLRIHCSIASLSAAALASPHFMSVYMWGPVLMLGGVLLSAKN